MTIYRNIKYHVMYTCASDNLSHWYSMKYVQNENIGRTSFSHGLMAVYDQDERENEVIFRTIFFSWSYGCVWSRWKGKRSYFLEWWQSCSDISVPVDIQVSTLYRCIKLSTNSPLWGLYLSVYIHEASINQSWYELTRKDRQSIARYIQIRGKYWALLSL